MPVGRDEPCRYKASYIFVGRRFICRHHEASSPSPGGRELEGGEVTLTLALSHQRRGDF